jgi:hypothetical protein
MNKIRIALFHCPDTSRYKLIKLNPEVSEDDPCLMWVFDSSKLEMARKITRNLNLASNLDLYLV